MLSIDLLHTLHLLLVQNHSLQILLLFLLQKDLTPIFRKLSCLLLINKKLELFQNLGMFQELNQIFHFWILLQN
uniref:Uncharacterized protein n=1 Tax=Meloidogyne enterolobii TaxID=390850 RepID=A0A6V7XDW7_MELEN|nr:unnamed protein product [Meloidogyne enterolobii]